MDQRNETFVPHVLAITTGTVVDFPNSDRIYHNVFSLSQPARFDLGRYAAGHSKSVRFDQPGIVRVFCDIHSHMNAFILVFSHPFFAVTDDEGRYRIDNVPPGTYSVVAWNEGVVVGATPVTVTDGGVADARLLTAMTGLSCRCAAGSSWRARSSRCSRSRVAIYVVNVRVTPEAEARAAARDPGDRRARRPAPDDAHRDVHA